MSGRARLYLLFGFMGRFLLVRVGFGFGLGIGLTVGGFFVLTCGLTFAKLLDGHGQQSADCGEHDDDQSDDSGVHAGLREVV